MLHGRRATTLSFTYAGQGIALGRQHAIGFGKSADDVAHGLYFNGRAELTIREFRVKLPAALPALEKRRPVLLTWGGEISGLIDLLAADVTMWADGGGKARGAATRVLHGADAVARFVQVSTSLPAENYTSEVAELNGEPALLLRVGGQAIVALFITVEDARVSEIRAVGNPDKLGRL